MKSKPAGIIELLAFGLVAVGALLLLVTQAGKLLALMLAAALPLAAWAYARWRAPRHVLAITGAACGLAAFPVSRALFSLLFALPFPFQLLGLLGLAGEALHGFPGNIVATMLHLARRDDGSLVHEVTVDYLFNGLFWAAVYGGLGSLFDRLRRAPPRRRRGTHE